MAGQKPSGRKKPARKRKVDLQDLSRSSQELSNEQSNKIKGGTSHGKVARIIRPAYRAGFSL
jgi:hypothetical protein